MVMFRKNFIPEEAVEIIKNFNYQRVDNSVLHKYFFGPIAEALVNKALSPKTPSNSLSLSSFIFTLISHIILLGHFPNELKGEVPRWLCFMLGLFQFISTLFDKMAHKQAIRSGGPTSPELLFSHCCHSLSLFLLTINIFVVLQLGNTGWAVLAYATSITVYFMRHWAECYSGDLKSLSINWANEGIMAVILIYFITGIKSTSIWNSQLFGSELKLWLLWIFLKLALGSIILHCVNVWKANSPRLKEGLFKLASLGLFLASLALAQILSADYVIANALRYVIYLFGISFAKKAGLLKIAHLTSTAPDLKQKSFNLIYVIFNLVVIITCLRKGLLLKEETAMMIQSVLALGTYVHFAVNLAIQLKEIHGVGLFDKNAAEKKLASAEGHEDEERIHLVKE